MITVIIPTRNRPKELNILLDKISRQTKPIKEVLIIDSSDTPFSLETSNDLGFNLKIHHTILRSAAIQRNIGMQMLTNECDYLCFLDDDVQPDPDYIFRLVEGLEKMEGIGISGIALNPLNSDVLRTKPRGVYGTLQRFFGLDSMRDGVILKSGVNIPVRRYDGSLQKVDWLIGCSMWKYAAVSDLRFEPDFMGQSLSEDVIFSYRASLRGDLFVDPAIHLSHSESEIGRPKGREFWSMWVVNRKRLVDLSSRDSMNLLFFHFANVGQFLSLFYSGVFVKRELPIQALGIPLGYFHLVRLKLSS
jgi:glycosyltransferase involved in cell wall biosynthesis